jgi:hypothetical protein
MTSAKAAEGFDHWGAAESGLQLGEIETRAYPACRYSAAQSGALIVFICIYLQAFPCLSMTPARFKS